LIAAFSFLKSFASGYGYVWYNPNELPGAFTAEDVAKIDNDLENMFFLSELKRKIDQVVKSEHSR
jgi:hypothetical protein